jgi:hypothetical protein
MLIGSPTPTERVNHYPVFALRVFMEATLCPHCKGEIEIDSHASGKFECPHCGRELAWTVPDDDSTYGVAGSGKFASMYAWFLHMARLVVTPLPLVWSLVLLPISLLFGSVSVLLSANFFIAGSELGSWMLVELTKFDFSDGLELFAATIFALVILPFAFLAYLIAALLGLFGLGIMVSAVVRLVRR